MLWCDSFHTPTHKPQTQRPPQVLKVTMNESEVLLSDGETLKNT